jgi:uncharacterized protein YndB with AHSA1/START domain
MGKLNVVAEPGTHAITTTREFDAPRELVFKAHTDPALVAKWWGLTTSTTVVDKLDVKPGGLWRFVEQNADGSEDAFHGVYHDVVAPERIVSTFEYEGMPGHVLLATHTFEETDGKTTLTEISVFQSVEDRDGMLQAGMEDGANQGMDQLEALLKTM